MCYMIFSKTQSTEGAEKLKKAYGAAKKFFFGDYFPCVAAFVVVFCYFANVQSIALIFLAASACFILLADKNLVPFLTPLLFVSFLFRDVSFVSSAWFFVIIAPVAICLIAHLFIYPLKNFTFGELSLPLGFVCAALFFGGIFSDYLSDYLYGLPTILTIGPLILIAYLFFRNYTCPSEDFDVKNYFALIFSLAAAIVSVQSVAKQFNWLRICWGNPNTCGIIQLLGIPFCFYLAAKKQQIIPYAVIILFLYLGTYCSGSDGALATACAFLPFMLFFFFKKLSKDKIKQIFVFIEVAAATACLFFIVKIDVFNKIIDKILTSVLHDNNRTPLYKKASDLFTHNPIFGAGLGYYNDARSDAIGGGLVRTYYFHSTFFQIIGSMGFAGLFAYVGYFFTRYRILTTRNTLFNLAAFFSFTLFTTYGFIDTCEFTSMPNMIFATVLIVVTELINNKNDNPRELPLYVGYDIKYTAYV